MPVHDLVHVGEDLLALLVKLPHIFPEIFVSPEIPQLAFQTDVLLSLYKLHDLRFYYASRHPLVLLVYLHICESLSKFPVPLHQGLH